MKTFTIHIFKLLKMAMFELIWLKKLLSFSSAYLKETEKRSTKLMIHIIMKSMAARLQQNSMIAIFNLI